MSIDTTRRRFLQTFAVASLVHPVLSSAGRPLSAQTHTSGPSEPFWEEVRRQFAFRDERVPMNAANLCPSPRVVAERVSQLTRDIDVDCSFPNRQKFGPLLEHSREAVARQLGVTADEIALVRNTSEANNIINADCRSTPVPTWCCGIKIIRPTTSPGTCAPHATGWRSSG